MLDNIKEFFKKFNKSNGKLINQKGTNKAAAKERLHLVLMQDRANVSADFLDLMKQEIIEVIKKYIDVDERQIDVKLTNKQNSDGTTGAPALYANIPIKGIKSSTRKISNAKKKDGNTNNVSTKQANATNNSANAKQANATNNSANAKQGNDNKNTKLINNEGTKQVNKSNNNEGKKQSNTIESNNQKNVNTTNNNVNNKTTNNMSKNGNNYNNVKSNISENLKNTINNRNNNKNKHGNKKK